MLLKLRFILVEGLCSFRSIMINDALRVINIRMSGFCKYITIFLIRLSVVELFNDRTFKKRFGSRKYVYEICLVPRYFWRSQLCYPFSTFRAYKLFEWYSLYLMSVNLPSFMVVTIFSNVSTCGHEF